MENHPKERRQYVRVYRNFILSYRQKGLLQVPEEVSQVNNVSKGGINFSSVRALEPGAMVSIEIKAPFITDLISLDGVVLECKEKVAGMIYEIRIKFESVPANVLDALDKIEKYAEAE